MVDDLTSPEKTTRGTIAAVMFSLIKDVGATIDYAATSSYLYNKFIVHIPQKTPVDNLSFQGRGLYLFLLQQIQQIAYLKLGTKNIYTSFMPALKTLYVDYGFEAVPRAFHSRSNEESKMLRKRLNFDGSNKKLLVYVCTKLFPHKIEKLSDDRPIMTEEEEAQAHEESYNTCFNKFLKKESKERKVMTHSVDGFKESIETTVNSKYIQTELLKAVAKEVRRPSSTNEEDPVATI